MKNFKITESEKKSILRKHNLILEQTGGNKTICDIQRSIGVSVDNVFGTETFDAVMAILRRKIADERQDGGGSKYEPDYYDN